MKRYLPNLLSIAALLLAALSGTGSAGAGHLRQISIQEGAPTVVSYQGSVTVGGVPHNGTGYFKFAVVDAAGNTTWSNDGTSATGNEPTASVALLVTNGLFNVLLGDTTQPGMTVGLTYSAFSTPDTYLRVWFSADGTTYAKLSPDQRIAATPYAMQAEIAKQAEAVGGYTGDQLALIGHQHAGVDISSGTVGAAYIDGAIARLNQITPTVWSSAGAGSGLNADLLDGQHGSYYTGQIVPAVTAAGFITRTLADSLYGGAYTAGLGLYLIGSQFNVNFGGSGAALAAARSDHKHPGTDITSTISSTYIGADIARVSQITTTLFANDGAGSGLDADLLDGQHAAAFVGLAGTQTITGTKTFNPASGAPFNVGAANTTVVTNLNSDLLDGQHGAYYTSQITSTLFANDGAGSGLDADLLDGQQGAAYMTLANAQTVTGLKTFALASGAPFSVSATNTTVVTNLNADLLDGQHGAYYTGQITPTVLANDGAGSGLDADLLDGQQGAAYMTLANAQTVTGLKTFNPASGAPFSVSASNTTVVNNLNADLLDGQHGAYYTGQITPTVLANDGAGSTLDADLLDGQQGAAYMTLANAQTVTGLKTFNPASGAPFSVAAANTTVVTNLNADLLDGQHSTYFQARVSQSCTVGSTIQVINVDGSVVCEKHDTRPTHVQTEVGTTSSSDPSLTIGSDGLPIISYYDGTNRDLKVVHCNTVDCKTYGTSTLDSGGDVGQDNSITIGQDGLALISYYDATTNGGNLKVAHCNDLACSSATLTDADDTTNRDGQYTSITIGTDGLGVISYYNYITNISGKLKIAHCVDVTCSATTNVTIEKAGWGTYYGKDTSIAINPGTGYPVIIFAAPGSTDGDLGILHCVTVGCTDPVHEIPVVQETNLNTGYNSSLSVANDGFFVMSYWNYEHGHLKFIHCDRTSCDPDTDVEQNIDDSGIGDNTYHGTAITLASDGMPLILYYNYAGHLKVLHCSNLNCSAFTAWDTDVVDIASNVKPAITVGMDEMPVYVYRNPSDGHLQVVHCSNQFCMPYFQRR